MEGGKGHFVLKILVMELDEALEEKFAGRCWKAADDDVIEGGGQVMVFIRLGPWKVATHLM